jgi:hypothetical protein
MVAHRVLLTCNNHDCIAKYIAKGNSSYSEQLMTKIASLLGGYIMVV